MLFLFMTNREELTDDIAPPHGGERADDLSALCGIVPEEEAALRLLLLGGYGREYFLTCIWVLSGVLYMP